MGNEINNEANRYTADNILVGYKPTFNFRRITNPPEHYQRETQIPRWCLSGLQTHR